MSVFGELVEECERIPAWLIWTLNVNGNWILQAIATKQSIAERYRKLFEENEWYRETIVRTRVVPTEIGGISWATNERLVSGRGRKYRVYLVFSYKKQELPKLPFSEMWGCTEENRLEIQRVITEMESSRNLVAITKTKELAKKYCIKIESNGLVADMWPCLTNHLFAYECVKGITPKCLTELT
jgi:hypothetical protein